MPTIPENAPATLTTGGNAAGAVGGTLLTQVKRYLAYDTAVRQHCTIRVTQPVKLDEWNMARTMLDASAIERVAEEMATAGLLG